MAQNNKDSYIGLNVLIDQIGERPSIRETLELLCEHGGFKNAVYSVPIENHLGPAIPFLRTTCSDAWIGRYFHKQYQTIDPILDEFRRGHLFFWHDVFKDASPEQMALLEDAIAYDVGQQGFSIPVIDRGQRLSLFSVTDDLDNHAWIEKINSQIEDLKKVAKICHDKGMEVVFANSGNLSLSPREIECLYWASQGNEVSAIARELDISEHTVRDYLKTARQKLDSRTVAQAVTIAIKEKIITPENPPIDS